MQLEGCYFLLPLIAKKWEVDKEEDRLALEVYSELKPQCVHWWLGRAQGRAQGRGVGTICLLPSLRCGLPFRRGDSLEAQRHPVGGRCRSLAIAAR